MFIFAQLGAIFLLVWALDSHPYSYYTLMRFVVFAVSAWACYLARDNQRTVWMWIYGVVAVLFNPFMPVHLDRESWAPIDLLVATILFVGLFFKVRKVLPAEAPKAIPASRHNKAPVTEPESSTQPVRHCLNCTCGRDSNNTFNSTAGIERREYEQLRFDLQRLQKRSFALRAEANRMGMDAVEQIEDEDGYWHDDEDADYDAIFEPVLVESFLNDFSTFVLEAEETLNRLSQNHTFLLFSDRDYEREKNRRKANGGKTIESSGMSRFDD